MLDGRSLCDLRSRKAKALDSDHLFSTSKTPEALARRVGWSEHLSGGFSSAAHECLKGVNRVILVQDPNHGLWLPMTPSWKRARVAIIPSQRRCGGLRLFQAEHAVQTPFSPGLPVVKCWSEFSRMPPRMRPHWPPYLFQHALYAPNVLGVALVPGRASRVTRSSHHQAAPWTKRAASETRSRAGSRSDQQQRK